ncbi:MAG: DUF547 domain-containing protein [Bacteroidota bacterium]
MFFRKKLSGDPISALQKLSPNSKPISHHDFEALLAKHVKNTGLVDYVGFGQDRTALQNYLKSLSNNPPNAVHWSENEQLAYWINAYNAFTVELVLQHYPVDSIKTLGPKLQIPGVNSVWDLSFFQIGGIDMTLNVIEHEILRKQFDEPRIHFAINCASFSCPNLIQQVYHADQLETQLQKQAIAFVNDPSKNRITAEQVELSQIFQWYAGDFTKRCSLIDYVQQFAEVRISPSAKIEYITYDWSLNGV